MSNVKHIQPDNETGKRRGSVFNTLSHVMRDIRELVFTTGFIMRNRPGLGEAGSSATGFVPVKNMFEAYYNEDGVEDKVNGIIIGRMGNGNKRNTNLVELTANCQPRNKNLELGYNNGAVKLRVTRDGENPPVDRTGVTVSDPQTIAPGDLEPGVTVHLVGQGYWGGVVISHVTNKDDSPTTGATGGRYIMILDDGVYIKGLPTSTPGGTGRLWNDAGTLKIT